MQPDIRARLLLFSRETRTMVQLFPSQASDATPLSDSMDDGDGELDGSPRAGSPGAFTALQLVLNPSASIYHGYETYIEDGLICLRHKIRNIEKKKVALLFTTSIQHFVGRRSG